MAVVLVILTSTPISIVVFAIIIPVLAATDSPGQKTVVSEFGPTIVLQELTGTIKEMFVHRTITRVLQVPLGIQVVINVYLEVTIVQSASIGIPVRELVFPEAIIAQLEVVGIAI